MPSSLEWRAIRLSSVVAEEDPRLEWVFGNRYSKKMAQKPSYSASIALSFGRIESLYKSLDYKCGNGERIPLFSLFLLCPQTMIRITKLLSFLNIQTFYTKTFSFRSAPSVGLISAFLFRSTLHTETKWLSDLSVSNDFAIDSLKIFDNRSVVKVNFIKNPNKSMNTTTEYMEIATNSSNEFHLVIDQYQI